MSSTSTVVLSDIPMQGCDEHVIRRALLQYGTAIDIQLHMNQAVVLMRTPQEAHAVAQRGSVTILGSSVRVVLDSRPSSSNPQQGSAAPGGAAQPVSYNPGFPQSGGNCLHILIEECQYTITEQTLMEMFSQVVQPTYVACSPVQGTDQVVGKVEFADAMSAQQAITHFNNKPIYGNSCFLHLSVDYHSGHPDPNGANPNGVIPTNPQDLPYPSQPMSNMYLQYPPPPQHQGMPSGWSRGRGRGGHVPQHSYELYHMMYGVPSLPQGEDAMGYQYPPQPYQHHQTNETAVMISNVALSVPLYDLWVLLEVYGNVNSLKRQYKDKTNVVAQFQNGMDAKTAVVYLNNCPFRGNLSLSLKLFAGYVERGGKEEWNSGPATDPNSHAVLFSGYHHRTKPSAMFNRLGRIRPDKIIFVSNLIESITDDELKAVFQASGAHIVEYYRKNAVGAIISFREIPEAIDALISVHAKKIQDRFLRVTFSRYVPGPPQVGGRENEETAAQAEG